MANPRPREPWWVALSGAVIRRLPRARYRLMNVVARRETAPFAAPLRVTDGALRFVCDLRDEIAREACFMGYYEPQETVLVREILEPGMTFVDVGANWGYFTLLAADRVTSTGRVIAFEPHPELFAPLAENVSANGLHWVTPLRVALSDATGEVELVSFAGDASNRGVSRIAGDPGASGKRYRVPTGRLDTLLDEAGVGDVDLLKMDIEGAEALVLPSLRESLARGRYRRILLELHPESVAEWGVGASDLVRLVRAAGYSAWRIDHAQSKFREAAYRLPSDAANFLHEHPSDAVEDRWPHLLFLAPGTAAPRGSRG